MSNTETYAESKERCKQLGYEIVKDSSLTWTFEKDGKRSVLGFNSEQEAVLFVLSHEPEPDKIFPPYKSEKDYLICLLGC